MVEDKCGNALSGIATMFKIYSWTDEILTLRVFYPQPHSCLFYTCVSHTDTESETALIMVIANYNNSP